MSDPRKARSSRRVSFEVLESRVALTGSITGAVYNDLNHNGSQDSGEAGILGRTVYLDLNANARLDAGETTTSTNEQGVFTFAGVADGSYSVRLQDVLGTTLTSRDTSLTAGFQDIASTVRRNVLFDTSRHLLIVLGSDGSINRWDYQAGTWLAAINTGDGLLGADTTADGKYLLLAGTGYSVTQGVVHKLDLDTGQIQDYHYNRSFGEIGSFDLKVAANGSFFVTTSFGGSGWVPLRQIDLATGDVTTRRQGVYQDGTIARSLDRSLLSFQSPGISSGPVYTYQVSTDMISNDLSTGQYLRGNQQAVSPNGDRIAMALSGFVSVMDSNYNLIHTAGPATGQMAFDPVRSLLYVLDASAGQIRAVDTNTWATAFTLEVGATIDYTETFGKGRMDISDDGNHLAILTPGGLRIFDLGTGGYRATVTEGGTAGPLSFGQAIAQGGGAPSISPQSSAQVPTPLMTIAPATGQAGPTSSIMTFTVSISAPSTATIKVNYTTQDQSAVAGLDYRASSGTLVFNPGETSKSIEVQLIGRAQVTPTRTFAMVLSSPSRVNLDPGTSAIGTILGYSVASVSVGFQASEFMVRESAGRVYPILYRAGDLSQVTTIHINTVSDRSQAGQGFAAIDGDYVFEVGSSTLVFPITILDDQSALHGGFILLVQAASELITITDPLSYVTIVNTDVSPVVALSSASYSANESDDAAVITLTRTKSLQTPIDLSLNLTDGTAHLGQNYKSATTPVHFDPGQTSVQVSIPLIRDNRYTSDLWLKLQVVNSDGVADLLDPSSAILTIRNVDPVPRATIVSATTTLVKKTIASITLTVSGDLDSTSANLATNWRLVSLDKKGKEGKPLAFSTATYNASQGTITLSFKKPITLVSQARLTAPGVTDTLHRPVLGKSATPFSALFSPTGKTITVTSSAVIKRR